MYFADARNHLYPDLAFEAELAQLTVEFRNGRRDLDLDDVGDNNILDFLLRRDFNSSKANWRQPEAATCRQDVSQGPPSKKLQDEALNCVNGDDADNRVCACDECPF